MIIPYARRVGRDVVAASQRRHHQERHCGSHVTDRDCPTLRLGNLFERRRSLPTSTGDCYLCPWAVVLGSHLGGVVGHRSRCCSDAPLLMSPPWCTLSGWVAEEEGEGEGRRGREEEGVGGGEEGVRKGGWVVCVVCGVWCMVLVLFWTRVWMIDVYGHKEQRRCNESVRLIDGRSPGSQDSRRPRHRSCD